MLEVYLKADSYTVVAHTAFTFRVNSFREVGSGLTCGIMTSEQLSLAIGETVVAGLHVVDGHLDRVA